MQDPNLLSTTEAGAEFGIAGSTVRRWVREGILQAKAAARGAYKVRREDVAKAVASRTQAPVAPSAESPAIRRAYTSGVSVQTICTDHGITKAELDAMRRAYKWTRSSDPFTDAEVAAGSVDALTTEALALKRQAVALKTQAAAQRGTAKAAASWWDFENQARLLVDDMARGAFRFDAPPKPARNWTTGPILGVVFPTDLHYGKYGTDALGPGRGDRDTALRRLFDHTYNLVSQAQSLGVEELLLYVGSDGVNADTALGTTTKGTPQSNDGEMAEIGPEGLQMWFDLVEMLRTFDMLVRVKTRPGNHDDLLTRVYGKALEIAYRGCEDVLVDPKALEYGFFEWGKCMVMDTHGHGRCTTKDLAEVMATHRPDLWGRCPYRYALRGNLHHTKDEEGFGIRNILLPSLSIGDAYHQLKWPALHRPTMRMPIFSQDRGMLALLESGPDWNDETHDWEVV